MPTQAMRRAADFSKMRVVLGLALLAGLAACASDPVPSGGDPNEPVFSSTEAPATGVAAAPATAATAAVKGAALDGPSGPCPLWPRLTSEPPVVVKGKNLVLTRIMKSCVTESGHRGYAPDTPYLAMGFPCTGGSGRIDLKGHYHNPKMLAFVIGTDCPMAPAGREQVAKVLADHLGVPGTAKLMAHTPFVVQYWELMGQPDADTGYVVELRSAPAIEGTWQRLQQHEPVRIALYGRENSWSHGGAIYGVQADLKMTGRTAFELAIVDVRVLNKEEIAKVRGRCEALRPARKCAEVF